MGSADRKVEAAGDSRRRGYRGVWAGESGSRAAALHTSGVLDVDGFAAFQAGERLDGAADFLLGEAQVVESL
jgi:hypothetical protein